MADYINDIVFKNGQLETSLKDADYESNKLKKSQTSLQMQLENV
mgnify:CR=1 FL=1